MSSLLLSVVHLTFGLFNFIDFARTQISTINKACTEGGSTCGVGQACIRGLCECDPAQRRFWAGNTYHCRVCPPDYIRTPIRCYKYYSMAKNQSEAREDCRKQNADLYSWRDNTDEAELLKALTGQWSYNPLSAKNQFYSWSGGMVHHGRGSRKEYKITWFDPKGPTIPHPDTNDPITERYCNEMSNANYQGDPEPTRRTKNGELENCVTIVFLPQPNGIGHICMADDYCSVRIGYLCEITEATLSNLYQTTPDPNRALDYDPDANPDNEESSNNLHGTDSINNQLMPSALQQASNNTIYFYIGGAGLLVVIIGIIVFIIINQRKKSTQQRHVSPLNSASASIVSADEVAENV